MITQAQAEQEGGCAQASRSLAHLGEGQRADQRHEKGVQRVDLNQNRLRPEGELKGQGQPGQQGCGAAAWLPRPQGLHQPDDDGHGGRGAERGEQGHATPQFTDRQLRKQPGQQRPGGIAGRMRYAQPGCGRGQLAAVRAVMRPGDGGRQGQQVNHQRDQARQQRHRQRDPITRWRPLHAAPRASRRRRARRDLSMDRSHTQRLRAGRVRNQPRGRGCRRPQARRPAAGPR